MNNHDYYGSNACGSYVRINGPDGQITVRIVDRCPECAPGDIDLSEEAFTRIADPVDGRVPITWKYVEGEVTGPVQYKFKEGSNPYWTAVQIRNHLNPVKNVEMKNENGQWEMLHREMYNYFIYDTGMGQGPYDIRLTDVFGQQVQDENIEFVEGGIVQGYCQFPSVNNR
jgi:expansin (peptidoglycan-binding protein)